MLSIIYLLIRFEDLWFVLDNWNLKLVDDFYEKEPNDKYHVTEVFFSSEPQDI